MAQQTDEIVLYILPRAWGLPSASPFCTKLETYLRLAELPYRVAKADFRRAPRGKFPYIERGGHVLTDSQLIIEHLEQTDGAPLDAGLTAAQVAKGHRVRRMLEEGTYFILVYFRWAKDKSFGRIRDTFRELLPAPLMLIVPRLARRGVLKSLRGQGVARYEDDELIALAQADLTALADALGDGPYLLGERPSSFDATAWAIAAHVLLAPFEGPIKEHARGLPNLVAYCDHIRERCWPDDG